MIIIFIPLFCRVLGIAFSKSWFTQNLIYLFAEKRLNEDYNILKQLMLSQSRNKSKIIMNITVTESMRSTETVMEMIVRYAEEFISIPTKNNKLIFSDKKKLLNGFASSSRNLFMFECTVNIDFGIPRNENYYLLSIFP